ncbi:hypothetical protein AHF37_00006 [Paragonimus kellicotti]|nr:hypothetical protein AHF37_00006 [Paragonimus kellicotti]
MLPMDITLPEETLPCTDVTFVPKQADKRKIIAACLGGACSRSARKPKIHRQPGQTFKCYCTRCYFTVNPDLCVTNLCGQPVHYIRRNKWKYDQTFKRDDTSATGNHHKPGHRGV